MKRFTLLEYEMNNQLTTRAEHHVKIDPTASNEEYHLVKGSTAPKVGNWRYR